MQGYCKLSKAETLIKSRRPGNFILRASETLLRLDLSIETERRNAEEQVSLREVEEVAAQISTWLRTSFEQFLSAETICLMDIDKLGEFKAHAIERFKGHLHSTVKASLRTNPIPEWAAAKVIEAWNVPGFKEFNHNA